jgi:hypothetical protein
MMPGAPRGAAIVLEDWVSIHGPLWPSVGVVVASMICARASALTDEELAGAIGSLNPGGVVRDDQGWSWRPAPVGASGRRVFDAEVIERIGAILFFCFTGQTPAYPFPPDRILRGTLRQLRSDLPVAIVELTVGALSVRRRRDDPTLLAFAGELRQVLGVERNAARRRLNRRPLLLGAAAAICAMVVGSWWAVSPRRGERPETTGLTAREAALLDVANESAQTFAINDEHTAAVQQYQQILKLWRTRVAPDDPRMAWYESHEAWVRALAGDRLTAEQLLEDKPSWFATALGEGHPYTRTARLGLAAMLEARGALSQAASLRAASEHATRSLLENTGLAPADLAQAPVPPGVRAHVRPNVAEREGFRRLADGEFSAPLTSAERWMAAREGWRLHVVAAGPCRASVDLGDDRASSGVAVSREADNRWHLRIDGSPAVSPSTIAPEFIGISIVAQASGAIEKIVGGQRLRLNGSPPAGKRPTPPYRLAFHDGSDAGCALVWLEIPFPSTAHPTSALH